MPHKYLIRKALAKARDEEELFCKLSGATKGTHLEDVAEHTDVWLDGARVDVKGFKRSHRKGYILLEFISNSGRQGWCSPAGADKIGFLMEDGFYLVDNEWLYKTFSDKCHHISEGKVLRKRGVKAEDALYKLVGRPSRKDVFTYVRLEDIKGGEYEFYGLE